MSTFKLQTAFALALIAGALPMANAARAADLDPGYADVPAPIPQQQVTFGSGWYVRGDMGGTEIPGISTSQSVLGSAPAVAIANAKRLGYSASLGAGYAFTNSVRVDAVADFHQPIQATQTGPAFSCQNGYGLTAASTSTAQTSYATYGTCRGDFQAKLNSYDVLVNAYYDFGTWYGITPYIGAGVGLSFGNYSTSAAYKQYDETSYNLYLTDPVSGSTYHFDYDRAASGQYYNFAFALMAGASYDIYSHTKLDVGYRYLSLGQVLGTHYQLHEVRAGLRYMIDN